MKSIRLAIISDLHYSQNTKSKKISPQVGHGTPKEPMDELLKLINQESLKADYLLCPGDITNQGDSEALIFGWEELNSLKNALNAKKLIASTGNHEVTSRPSEAASDNNPELSIEPVEHLITTKDYPTDFENDDRKWVYWGRGYEIVENDDAIIVIINSCHAHITTRALEYERGKISETTFHYLKIDLEKYRNSHKFKIILMHHNPHMMEIESLGRTPTYNGDKLLRDLQSHVTPWIIIHGHKHFPEISKAAGTGNPPFIFSAGSFGASISGAIANISRNQFYFIDLEIDDHQLKGKVEAFHFDYSSWNKSRNIEHGLPYGCGFSTKDVQYDVFEKIVDHVKQNEGKIIYWDSLYEEIPEINYLTPNQIKLTREKLNSRQINITGDNKSYFPHQLYFKKLEGN